MADTSYQTLHLWANYAALSHVDTAATQVKYLGAWWGTKKKPSKVDWSKVDCQLDSPFSVYWPSLCNDISISIYILTVLFNHIHKTAKAIFTKSKTTGLRNKTSDLLSGSSSKLGSSGKHLLDPGLKIQRHLPPGKAAITVIRCWQYHWFFFKCVTFLCFFFFNTKRNNKRKLC